MIIDELISMLEMQEEILQFTHFTNEDAWELGQHLVAEIHRRKLPVAVTIRLNNGYTLFRYAAEGTNLHNEHWMQRKFNTVKTLEHSSLHTCMMLRKNEESLADWFLDERDYAAVGGGFPIRVEEVGVIGAIIVSGLPHMSDHDLIIKTLSRYLHIDEVPRIRTDAAL
ncbi:MAG: heme-degrading domain-containing protein [Eubacteriales bacterium]|nr:heme-degrading domain-containing protein [Eubacteriales bacterium]